MGGETPPRDARATSDRTPRPRNTVTRIGLVASMGRAAGRQRPPVDTKTRECGGCRTRKREDGTTRQLRGGIRRRPPPRRGRCYWWVIARWLSRSGKQWSFLMQQMRHRPSRQPATCAGGARSRTQTGEGSNGLRSMLFSEQSFSAQYNDSIRRLKRDYTFLSLTWEDQQLAGVSRGAPRGLASLAELRTSSAPGTLAVPPPTCKYSASGAVRRRERCAPQEVRRAMCLPRGRPNEMLELH
jgi:hypothetical protein